jgi:hypothetical protein
MMNEQSHNEKPTFIVKIALPEAYINKLSPDEIDVLKMRLQCALLQTFPQDIIASNRPYLEVTGP